MRSFYNVQDYDCPVDWVRAVPTVEQLIISIPSDIATEVRDAVQDGHYSSASDIVQEALRDWQAKRLAAEQGLAELKTDIHKGIADAEAGRLLDFDIDRVARQGRARSVRG